MLPDPSESPARTASPRPLRGDALPAPAWPTPPSAAVWAAALLIAFVGGWLRLNDLDRVPYLADEPEDMTILWTIQQAPNPFQPLPEELQPALDQARLPFYLTGAALAITGRDDLLAARYVSVMAAMGTVLLLFLLGARLIGAWAGLLASAMLTFSIYDIGFSRLAMTSSQTLLCFFYLLALYAWARGIQEGRVGWLALAAAAAGWAAGAKFFGVMALAVFVLVPPSQLVSGRGGAERRSSPAAASFLRAWLVPVGAALGVFALIALVRLPRGIELTLFAAAAVLGLAGGLQAILRHGWRSPTGLGWGGLLVLLATAFTFHLFLATPFHLDGERLVGIFGVFPKWHTGPLAQTGVLDLALVLLVRLSIPFAPLLLFALVYYVRRWAERGRRLILAAFLLPLVVLSLFPFKVTWYPTMVLPVAYLMIGDYLAGWGSFLAGASGRAVRLAGAVSAALLLGTAGWYGVHAASLHPWYELDGYQLGPSMVGWSRPAMLSYEGLPEAMARLEAELPAGAEVACHFVDIPRYNRYAVEYLRWYARRPDVGFLQVDSVTRATEHALVLTTFYSRSAHAVLEAEGYRPVRLFWILGMEYGRLWTRSIKAGKADTRLAADRWQYVGHVPLSARPGR